MNIIAFDTSTENLGIALKTNNTLYTIALNESLKHSEKLLPLTETLFNAAAIKTENIDLVICSKGPGSFTGLRIGMATAKGIAFALSVPFVSVPTLDFLASDLSFFDGAVIPVIDAKRKRYYTAIYEKGSRKTDYLDAEYNEIIELSNKYKKILLTGPYSSKLYNDILANKDIADENIFLDPRSNDSKVSMCLEIGVDLYNKGLTDKDDSEPIYIRKSDAEEKSVK
ncbi:MAG: tRNA (adenosine(37)-N6)-threonylcarbamoyltransferase complex dimerization subunit type 1 TsaB [Spirochaetaceae bacterium]|nr:tRNA (adenosine(37)-N6)-threonylcarbamoyltransferase complex dimerization subunit type 1 TsaB [Spirochaetaceae bacterium]